MAAGEGRRLRPLTERWPKPLLPIDGRPVIATLLRELRAAGCLRVTVVTGHLAEQVERLLGDGSGFGLELRTDRRTPSPARSRLKRNHRFSSPPPTPSSVPGTSPGSRPRLRQPERRAPSRFGATLRPGPVAPVSSSKGAWRRRSGQRRPRSRTRPSGASARSWPRTWPGSAGRPTSWLRLTTVQSNTACRFQLLKSDEPVI